MFKRTPNKPVRASLRAFEVVFRFLCGNKRYFCILHAEDFVAKGKYARAVSCNNAGLFAPQLRLKLLPFAIILRIISCSVSISSPLVASSSSSIGASRRIALAMASRCACPSLMPCPFSPMQASMPPILVTKRSAHAASSAAVNSSSDASGRTMRRFSAIVPEKPCCPAEHRKTACDVRPKRCEPCRCHPQAPQARLQVE